jgi:hypothetical protein
VNGSGPRSPSTLFWIVFAVLILAIPLVGLYLERSASP